MTDYNVFLSRAAHAMHGSAIRRMGILMADRPDVISFAPGYPAPDTFPWDEFREIAAELLTGRDGTVLQYGPTRGFGGLIEALGDILAARGIRATVPELVVTTGSQQGLDLVARILIDPGDVVLVELPTYTGAITAFRNVQATLVGVRQEGDGIDLDHLDAVLARERGNGRRVRFLYVVPNFQNPTGLLIGLEKRRRLLEQVARRDLLIVEDDPYGDLYFEDSATAADTRPLKADDAEGRVVYLSSFSKTLAPGYRVAWLVAPAEIAAKFETAKQAIDLCTGAFDQRIVHEAWRRGLLAAQVPRLREHYRVKRDAMSRALACELGSLVDWPQPRGGFFLWITLPDAIDADVMIPRALDAGVLYVAGSAFFVEDGLCNTVRLAFSAADPERITEGVHRLASAIREELGQKKEKRKT